MATEYGFVYVLANESMPGIYKIGYTTGHPKNRMAQLSSSTACPTPFSLLAAFGCEKPSEVEAEIHSILDQYRVNSSREFFQLSVTRLLLVLRCYTNKLDGDDLIFLWRLEDYVKVEQYEFDCEKYDREQKLKIKHFYSQSADPIDWSVKMSGFK